ncbi:InlB B-repeat-containing protein [Litoribacillus peritrichatus]|uniref:Bacterial repeat domain-containing protein n=1 Tax=Litoribacillus peritrichatus TaxID=718191 RepID=A0ABP7M7V2_9GAMM
MSKLLGRSVLLLVFILLGGCKLAVDTQGRGNVTSKSGLVHCGTSGTNCRVDYEKFSDIASSYTEVLTAHPDSGYQFTGWSGDCSGTGTCSIKINKLTGSKNVTAHFTQLILSDKKDLTEFKFRVADNPSLPSDISGSIDQSSGVISLVVPSSTNLTMLVASFITTGEEVTVDGVPQESASSVNDFSSNVSYQVEAENGSEKHYLVKVSAVSFEAKAITDFRFTKQNNDQVSEDVIANIDEAAHTISLLVADSTDVSSLIATFETTGQQVFVNGVEQYSGITPNSFNSAVVYRVVAGNQSVQDYTVTVTESACLEEPWVGNYTIESLQDAQALAGYTSVTGALVIGSYNSSSHDLLNLDDLSCVRSVGSLSVISNEALETLNGLNSLSEVKGSLVVRANPELVDLSALSSLTRVNTLSLSQNNKLANLDGLQSITEVDALVLDDLPEVTELDAVAALQVNLSLAIKSMDSLVALPDFTNLAGNTLFLELNGNPVLNDLNGLAAQTELKTLVIRSNPQLESLAGLQNITTLNKLTLAGNTALSSLEGLSGLQTVRDVVIESNHALTNLVGLSALTNVSGDIQISSNDTLVSTEGLTALTSLSGGLTLEDNSDLSDLSGFSRITGDLNIVTIENNDSLQTLNGLSSVRSANQVIIKNNAQLQNLQGLNGLTSVSKLFVEGNDALLNLNGLGALTQVNGQFAILNNNNMQDLSGVTALKTISGDFDLERNNKLVSVDGLNNLERAGTTSIRLNPQLSDLGALNKLTQLSGSLIVFGNNQLADLSGLSNLASIGSSSSHDLEIRGGFLNSVSLTGLTSVSGDVFIDGSSVADLNMPELCNVGQHFKVSRNASLCTSEAEALRDQVQACGGLSNIIDVSGNAACN